MILTSIRSWNSLNFRRIWTETWNMKASLALFINWIRNVFNILELLYISTFFYCRFYQKGDGRPSIMADRSSGRSPCKTALHSPSPFPSRQNFKAWVLVIPWWLHLAGQASPFLLAGTFSCTSSCTAELESPRSPPMPQLLTRATPLLPLSDIFTPSHPRTVPSRPAPYLLFSSIANSLE